MERKINEEFTVNGKTYVTVESTDGSCESCVFYCPGRCCRVSLDKTGYCHYAYRNDKKDVIFKEVCSNNSNVENMKPFNLEEAKAGKPVCTRNGHPVRIVCYDCKSRDDKRLIALIDINGAETLMNYYENGRIFNCNNVPCKTDLMMATKKKRGYIALYKPTGSKAQYSLVTSYVYPTMELLENYIDKKNCIAIKEIEWEE